MNDYYQSSYSGEQVDATLDEVSRKINRQLLGQPGGVATLDANGKIPIEQLPPPVQVNTALGGDEENLLSLTVGNKTYKTTGAGNVISTQDNNFSGQNTFVSGKIKISDTNFETTLYSDKIVRKGIGNIYLPAAAGTLATTGLVKANVNLTGRENLLSSIEINGTKYGVGNTATAANNIFTGYNVFKNDGGITVREAATRDIYSYVQIRPDYLECRSKDFGSIVQLKLPTTKANGTYTLATTDDGLAITKPHKKHKTVTFTLTTDSYTSILVTPPWDDTFVAGAYYTAFEIYTLTADEKNETNSCYILEDSIKFSTNLGWKVGQILGQEVTNNSIGFTVAGQTAETEVIVTLDFDYMSSETSFGQIDDFKYIFPNEVACGTLALEETLPQCYDFKDTQINGTWTPCIKPDDSIKINNSKRKDLITLKDDNGLVYHCSSFKIWDTDLNRYRLRFTYVDYEMIKVIYLTCGLYEGIDGSSTNPRRASAYYRTKNLT